MEDRAGIILKCDGDEIFVICEIRFAKPISSFTFSINSLLNIDSIISDSECTYSKSREWNPTFRALSQEIMVSIKAPTMYLAISYHGKICGWANIVEETRIALSSYSAWFPQETSEVLSINVLLQNMDNYFVLNAQYDDLKKEWKYGDNEHDRGNIIALKSGCYYETQIGNFTFYYINEKENRIANYLTLYYKDIIQYYSQLFGKRELSKFDVVSLGKSGGGAYFRKELVVCERFDYHLDDERQMQIDVASLLAHELGHNWFSGANVDSWEDWLNETGATWASLLYALHCGNNDLFSDILKWPKESFAKAPPIKTIDGSRPTSGVHERGTIMFYELFKHYGKECIILILRNFLELEDKTTDNLLSSLSNKIGNEIPEIIKRGLTITDYSMLC